MRSVLRENTYKGFNLINSSKNYQGYYKEILHWIYLLLDNMIKKHSCVLFVRFDLHYPAGSSMKYHDNNDMVSKFSETFMLYCKRHGYDPKYLWARELSKTGQLHYHFILLLDGNRIKNAHRLILGYATELWQRYLGIEDGSGLVHLCISRDNNCYHDDQHGGVMIMKKDPYFHQVYGKCYQLASYLAKCYSKSGLPFYTNGYGCSKS